MGIMISKAKTLRAICLRKNGAQRGEASYTIELSSLCAKSRLRCFADQQAHPLFHSPRSETRYGLRSLCEKRFRILPAEAVRVFRCVRDTNFRLQKTLVSFGRAPTRRCR